VASPRGARAGFGALADPQGWLERIEGLGRGAGAGEFLDAGRCWKRRDGCGSSFAKKR